MKNVIIMGTRASRYLVDRIAIHLGVPKMSIERKRFGDGQQYYRLPIENRFELTGKDVIYVASTHTDIELLELSRVGGDLTTEYGTRRRIFVIPYFGSSTMDRAVKPGEIVVAKHDARMLSQLPYAANNAFLLLDTHTEGLVHYFEGDCFRRELYAEEVLVDAVRKLNLKNYMFASADLGRPKWVKTFATIFGTKTAFVAQERCEGKKGLYAVIGNVRGKNVVIYDDMSRSGKTLLNATHAYIRAGALSVWAVISHLGFNNNDIITNLIHSPIKRIISTNSHPMSQSTLIRNSPKFIVTDVSRIFADVIKKFLVS